MEQRKRNISVRLSSSDIKKVKDISQRLGVKESELFRFAIKNMLTKLMPLSDSALMGADLIPTWIECGNDLLSYFDIDVDKLDEVFNAVNVDGQERVDELDLDLMILANLNQYYAVKKLSEICGAQIDPADVTKTLKTYLYDKYVLGKGCDCSGVDVSVSANGKFINRVTSVN